MKRITGILFLAFPLLIQIPYGLLAVRFGYPETLRAPAEEILRRFAAGGESLACIWWLYGMCVLPLMAAICGLPRLLVLPEWVTMVGLLSGLAQWVGLMRWSVVVPGLARAYGDGGGEIVLRVFSLQHEVLGTLVGEMAGQMLLAWWTFGVAGATREWPAWHRWIGRLAAAGFAVNSQGVLPEACGTAAFLVWSGWCVALGWLLLRAELRGRKAKPATDAAMEDTRFSKAEQEGNVGNGVAAFL